RCAQAFRMWTFAYLLPVIEIRGTFLDRIDNGFYRRKLFQRCVNGRVEAAAATRGGIRQLFVDRAVEVYKSGTAFHLEALEDILGIFGRIGNELIPFLLGRYTFEEFLKCRAGNCLGARDRTGGRKHLGAIDLIGIELLIVEVDSDGHRVPGLTDDRR